MLSIVNIHTMASNFLDMVDDFFNVVLLHKIISIAGLIFLFYILKRFLSVFMNYQLNENKTHRFRLMSFQRKQTIIKLINNGLHYVMLFFLVYSILSILGVPVATLVASAGIAGLAIGFGAKDFVADLVNGFFIVVENQLDVGDSVSIEGIDAKVKEAGLRTTILEGFDGTIHYISNSEIRMVSNLSQSDRRIFTDLPLFNDTNLSQLEAIVERVTPQIVQDYENLLAKEPIIRGPVMQPDGQFSYRIVWYVDRNEFANLQSAFYSYYFKEMQKENVPFAKPLSYLHAVNGLDE